MTTHHTFFQTWTFRVLFAFFFSPGIAILSGVLLSLDVTSFEGADGFAFVYTALWSLPFAFLLRVRCFRYLQAFWLSPDI